AHVVGEMRRHHLGERGDEGARRALRHRHDAESGGHGVLLFGPGAEDATPAPEDPSCRYRLAQTSANFLPGARPAARSSSGTRSGRLTLRAKVGASSPAEVLMRGFAPRSSRRCAASFRSCMIAMVNGVGKRATSLETPPSGEAPRSSR